jgi:hypothetical protein
MNSERRAIFQLLALGRINAAQAERLLAAAGADRESLWAIAGCAAIALVTQSHWLGPQLEHVARAATAGAMPVLHHALSMFLGGQS